MADLLIPLFWTWKGTSTSITGSEIRSHSHVHLTTLYDACSIAAHISVDETYNKSRLLAEITSVKHVTIQLTCAFVSVLLVQVPF